MQKFIFRAIANTIIGECVKVFLPLAKNILFGVVWIFFCLTILPFLNSISEMAGDIFAGRPIFLKCLLIFSTLALFTGYLFKKYIHYTFQERDAIAGIFGCLSTGFAITFLLYIMAVPAAQAHAKELKETIEKVECCYPESETELLKNQCSAMKTLQDHVNILAQLEQIPLPK